MIGRQARSAVPRETHAQFSATPSRNVVDALRARAAAWPADQASLRFGRMLHSPFAYYCGAAAPMADDLAGTPSAGLLTQLIGDAHPANFAVHATPRRRLVFDVVHFDETAPGPFEWDVKRLAAGLELLGRVRDDRPKARRDVVQAALREYRETMRDFATATTMAVWDVHLAVSDTLLPRLVAARRRSKKAKESAAARADLLEVIPPLSKLVRIVDERAQLSPKVANRARVANLPDPEREQVMAGLEAVLAGYPRTLSPEWRHLVTQFRLVDAAGESVGISGLGPSTHLLLLDGGDGADPLLLRARRAGASVLEPHVGPLTMSSHGQRVATGQRLVQAATDGLLGWHRSAGAGPDGADVDYVVAQVRDGVDTIDPESLTRPGLELYARMCGWTLAHAHARAGDRIAIAAYLGGGDRFDRAVAEFADAYADQIEADHATLEQACAAGLVAAKGSG